MIKVTKDTTGTRAVPPLALSGEAVEAFEAIRAAMVAERPDTSPTDLAVITAALKFTGTRLTLGDVDPRHPKTNEKREIS